jgi:threonine dehydrogenase-like Zn-dependent dehydrogenase
VKAFVITAPGKSVVAEVEEPQPLAGEVVVKVTRAGICGTDVELFDGTMSYLHNGQAQYPLRIGHEWCGVVTKVGDGVDKKWLGKRVTGDTMLGCQKCWVCLNRAQHLCPDRYEIGIRNGWHGALAEQLSVPEWALFEIPDSIDDVIGALIEPGGNADRVARAAEAAPGKKILIYGTGTIGLLSAQFSMAMGAEVHMVGQDPTTMELARKIGVTHAGTEPIEVENGFDAVVDASNGDVVPSLAMNAAAYGGKIVYIGISSTPSYIDSRTLVFRDLTAIGILSASPGLPGAIRMFSSGEIDPLILIAGTVSLYEAGSVLSGHTPVGAGVGTKILVDPTL